MHTRFPIISLFLVSLIGIVLSLSTVHSHGAIQANVHQGELPGVEHSIEQSIPYCPICGYMQRAGLNTGPGYSQVERIVENAVIADSERMHGPYLRKATGRSPPPARS